MRPILMGDIVAAARALREARDDDWPQHMTEMLYRAQIADKVVKRTGQPHRLWGNGCLMAAAFPTPKKPEPFLDDITYLVALRTVVDGLLQRKLRNLPQISAPAMDDPAT
ncbi:hypothetical protein [Pseudorhodobacter sp.]|uniref:DUF7742 family protein n=1 Tax=Pseudorhodobacter sp. TaxID=1934400 RepID=UPI002649CB50|nr:hypothetical protein [Pseudorhodobacter sp.]MDN5786012.1 hypothetical protein [Pseudorhodobacter sp.]